MLADMLLLIPLPTEFPYKFVLWLVCVWLVHEEFLYRHRPTEKRNIALIEYPTWIGRRLSGLRYLWAGPKITNQFYKSQIPYGVRTPETFYVHFSSETHIKQLENASEELLSLHALSKDMFQPRYTMNGLEVHDKMNGNGSLHTRVLRVILQSRLPELRAPLSKIIERTFLQQLLFQEQLSKKCPGSEGFTSLPIFSVAKTVATAANALTFFGPQLSSNAEFLRAAQSYPEDLLTTAEILRFTPSFMAPFIATFTMRNHQASKIMIQHLTPLVDHRMSIKQRQAERKTNGGFFGDSNHRDDEEDKPCDIIQFFIDSTFRHSNEQKATASSSWSAQKIVQVILGIWFAAVHQPAMSMVYALQDLVDYPEYLEHLRQELTSNSAEAIDSLPLLDSFLKESSRLHPSDAISMRRKVLQPFTFSDGTHLRAGDVACVPSKAIMRDAAHYGMNRLTFDAFRFVKSKGGDGTRFTDTSPTYPFWGLGRHSCPGRFYASYLLKIFLAHVIMNYDVLGNDPKPLSYFASQKSFYFRSAIVPRANTTFKFQKRR